MRLDRILSNSNIMKPYHHRINAIPALYFVSLSVLSSCIVSNCDTKKQEYPRFDADPINLQANQEFDWTGDAHGLYQNEQEMILQPESLFDHTLASKSMRQVLVSTKKQEDSSLFSVPKRQRRSAPIPSGASSSKEQGVQLSQKGSVSTVDACPSRMEVITPYYATNSKGKLRTLVHSELMQQAIQVEICHRTTRTNKCNGGNNGAECGCEQKYKWHRLLVFDPANSQRRSLFMDWFLFPSSCVCRCKSQTSRFMQLITTPPSTTTISSSTR